MARKSVDRARERVLTRECVKREGREIIAIHGGKGEGEKGRKDCCEEIKASEEGRERESKCVLRFTFSSLRLITTKAA